MAARDAIQRPHDHQLQQRQLRDALDELQAELDEFRESSAQLEQELEAELQSVEKRAMRAERDLERLRETSAEATTRLTRELLKCQREMAQLREQRHASMKAVREKEEALEQAAENERRANAQVEALRDALDATVERAAFTQTELEDLKKSSAEQTRHLFEDLEDAHAEIALLTPIQADAGGNLFGLTGSGCNSQTCGSKGSGWGSVSRSGTRGRCPRRFFNLASFDEAAGLDCVSPVAECNRDVSPTTCERRSLGVDADDHSVGRHGRGALNDQGSSPIDLGETTQRASEGQEELRCHLQLCASSPSLALDGRAALDSARGRCSDSQITSVTDCASCCSTTRHTPGVTRPRSWRWRADDARWAQGAPANSVLVDMERDRCDVSASTERDPVPPGGRCTLTPAMDASVYKNWDSDDDVQQIPSTTAKKLPDRSSPWDLLRALSSWQPFGWCHPG